MKVHSTIDPEFSLQQTLQKAHKLGCHHLATSKNGLKLASVGFEGEAKIWALKDGQWSEEGKIVGADFYCLNCDLDISKQADTSLADGNKAGEIWAVALSEDGQYLASTTFDGRINVWDCLAGREKIREYETKGSYGMAIDLVNRFFLVCASDPTDFNLQSADGRYTASGHQNGSVYIFSNDTGRLLHSLPGPVDWCRISPSMLTLIRPCQTRSLCQLLSSVKTPCSCW